ncbi:MAG: hypothetical protein A2Y10_10695 [Planctomycetes bacterium GWF2_41_51]|nr:MAG: hypothetical protein A2Y10_10695 [Planctomycetes bacterium GWF2_41_51]HBG28487.1 hypothetical protein [Phycisphaerales bacterium]
MKIFLLLAGSLVFLVSACAYIFVKLKLKPKQDSEIDDIYWEFEDSSPDLARYNKLSQITFGGVVMGMILLFLSVIF